MRLNALLPLLLLLGACATQKHIYRLQIDGRADDYTEKEDTPLDQALSQLTGRTATITQGDASTAKVRGYGGQFGFTEESARLITRVSFFYTKFADLKYGFNVEGLGDINETLSLTSYGLDAGLALRVGWLRPEFSYMLSSQHTKAITTGAISDSSNTSDSVMYIGGGLGLEIPLAPTLRMIFSGQYRVPLNMSGGTAKIITATAGIKIGGWVH